ncbi:hypothetical protein IscW_ISCW013682, partial [Ixodes scapularis]
AARLADDRAQAGVRTPLVLRSGASLSSIVCKKALGANGRVTRRAKSPRVQANHRCGQCLAQLVRNTSRRGPPLASLIRACTDLSNQRQPTLTIEAIGIEALSVTITANELIYETSKSPRWKQANFPVWRRKLDDVAGIFLIPW